MDRPRTLVISGGSVKGIALLGALQCLQDRGYTGNIRTIIGTSVGAMIGYLYAIGYSPVELMVHLCRKGFLENMISIDTIRLLRGDGIAVSDFISIQDRLERMTITKIGRLMTLAQLEAKTGVRLVAVACNMCTGNPEYLSPDNNPDMPCIAAIRASCTLPVLFEPFRYGDSVYIDGGVVDNFAIHQASEPPVIGLQLSFRVVDRSADSVFPTTLLDLLNRVFNMFMNGRTVEKTTIEGHTVCMIRVSEDVHLFKFLMDTSQKFELFSNGYDTAATVFPIFQDRPA